MGIKRLEKDPDHKNIFDTLINDAVGRNKNLWQFASFCSAQESRCSIALDGEWGTGKTFFLKQLQMLFDAYSVMPQTEDSKKEQENHPNSNNDKKHFQKIKDIIKQQFNVFNDKKEFVSNAEQVQLWCKLSQYKDGVLEFALKKHVCFYYDAWLNDNADDPMRSLLYEIITRSEKIKPFEDRCLFGKILNLLCRFRFLRKYLFLPSLVDSTDALCKTINDICPNIPTGIISTLLKPLKKNNPVHDFELQKKFHKSFDQYLNGLILNNDERLLILIDELDRCKPTYAVQLLERIKHYLSNDKITFVFAVNEKQLQHTIKAFYGDGFDAYQYLNRFFDVQFSLPEPDVSKLLCMLHLDDKDKNTYLYKSACESFISVNSLSIRESIKYCQIVDFVCKSFQKDTEKSQDVSWKFVMYIIVPVVIGLRFVNGELLANFLKGTVVDRLSEVVLRSEILSTFLTIQTPLRDHYVDHVVSGGVNSNDRGKIAAIYHNLLGLKLDNLDENTPYPFSFTKEMLNTIYSASNMMADFIKYDTNTEETANG